MCGYTAVREDGRTFFLLIPVSLLWLAITERRPCVDTLKSKCSNYSAAVILLLF